MEGRQGISLITKITSVGAGIILISLLSLGIFSYQSAKKELVSKTFERISGELERVSEEITLLLNNQAQHISTIAQIPAIKAMLRAMKDGRDPETGWNADEARVIVEQIFIAVANEYPEFFQIRLIGLDGMEIVRLETTSQGIRFRAKEELQDKSHRYYFTEAMKLQPGSVYISPLDLNVEHGRIEVPHRPTYRMAVPILDKGFRKMGILVVNVEARCLLRLINVNLKGGVIYMVDQQGYFLEHPNPSMRFGRELGTGHSLSTTFPELAWWMKSPVEEHVGLHKSDKAIYGIRKIYYAGWDRERFWGLIEVVPFEVALAAAYKLRYEFLLGGGIIVALALVLSLFVSRSFSRPLVQLSRVAQRVAEGDLNVYIEEEKRKDELGVLARSFNRMIASLREATQNLREQVAKQTEELSRRNKELQRQTRYLEEVSLYNQTFVDVLSLFTTSHELSSVCNSILPILAERHRYPVGLFYIYDGWTDKLILSASHAAPSEVEEEIDLSEGIIGGAVSSDGPTLIPLKTLSISLEIGLGEVQPAAVVVVPVKYQERLLGAMILAALSEPSQEELEFLRRLSFLVGSGMNSLHQFLNLQDLSQELQKRQREIEEKNRELLQAQRMKDQFLANMSHELRTPLNSIIGFADLLKEQVFGPLNEKQLQYTQNILESGEHLLSLINDILDLSKVEAGMMELEPEEIILKDLLESSLTMVREKAAKHNISLSLEVDEEIERITSDSRRLKQIMFNLLSNAVKFTPDGGSVTVRAKKLDGEIQISVSDTGIGIPKEQIERIFEPFVQLDSSLSRQYEGTGLGLALTRRLVELLGGRIWVESEPGKGSTFYFTIPMEPLKVKEGEDRRMVARDMERPLVLIVEDDPKFASLIRDYLEGMGCRTVIAPDGAEGLKMAQQLKPDLITLDILMPVMDGWQFLGRLNEDEKLRGTPVVIVSVLHEEEKSLALGASAVLQKPIDRSSLVAALEKAGFPTGCQAKVLVVDDDPNAVEIISAALSSNGYTVLRAYSGKDGVEIAKRERPDMIVLDLMMPGMNGFEVIDHLKSDPITRDIPIIVLTAKFLTEEDARRLNGYIVSLTRKSEFRRERFLEEVKNVLRRKPVNHEEEKRDG